MSKPSRRANRQGILELRKQKRKAEKKLRQAQRGQNVVLTPWGGYIQWQKPVKGCRARNSSPSAGGQRASSYLSQSTADIIKASIAD